MPLFASQQPLDALGLPLSSLEKTLQAFHVSFGTPEDLAAFPRRLARDEQLQKALGALIRARQRSSPGGAEGAAGRLSLYQALDGLLHVVGGAPAPDLTANPTLHETVDLLISFLISLDGWNSAELEEAVAPAAPATDGREAAEIGSVPVGRTDGIDGREQDGAGQIGAGQIGAGQMEQRAREEADLLQEEADREELARLLRETSGRSEDGSGGTDGDGAAGAPALGNLAQLLTRLELNNLELRLQLESIDSRLNRMEPRIESIPRSQPEVGSASEPEAPAPVARQRGDKSRYTTAAAFSAIPLSPEPSPFAGEVGAAGREAGAGTREAGFRATPVVSEPGAEGLPPRPPIAPFASAEVGSAESGGTPFGAQTGAQGGPASAPRAVVLRYAAAESAQSSEATDARPEVRDDLLPKGEGVSSGLGGGALAIAPPPQDLPQDPEAKPASAGATASPGNAAPVAPTPLRDLASAPVSGPAAVSGPAGVSGASSPARSAPFPSTSPTAGVSAPAFSGLQPPIREPRSVGSGDPGKRSGMTRLRLNDSPPEPLRESDRVDAVTSVASDFDAQDATPVSDRRRRWRATLIVVFLLLLAAGALAAFLFLGNPETTTFRGAADQPVSCSRTS